MRTTARNDKAPRGCRRARPQGFEQAAQFYRRAGRSDDHRPRLDFATVAAEARNRWPAILPALGIDDACLIDRHGQCPGCGGRDRFRFDDREGRGTWLCSAGGGKPLSGDGFGLLTHAHGWQPGECLRRVAEALGLAEGRARPPTPLPPPRVQSGTTGHGRSEQHRQAAERAQGLWAGASSVSVDHPYLRNKRVGAHGLRQIGSTLVMPLRDGEGRLWSLQFIDAEGGKRFLRGGRVAGCFHRIARPDSALDVVLLGEGYATCAAAHEATGHPAAVAHSAGNLPAVALALRARYPRADLVLLVDDDPAGRRYSERAARAVGGRLALPPEVGHGA